MSRAGARLAGLTALGLLPLAVLAACGDGSSDPGEEAASSSPTTSPSATDSRAAGVVPATGKDIVLEHVSLTAPQGWTLEHSSGVSITANAPNSRYYAYVTAYDQPVGPGADSLRNLAKLQVSSQGEIRDPEILPNTEVAGEPVYHLGGPVSRSLWVDGYGPSVDGAIVDLYFTFIKTVPLAERQKIVDSVLATVQWDL